MSNKFDNQLNSKKRAVITDNNRSSFTTVIMQIAINMNY